jgi:hypothetical protein
MFSKSKKKEGEKKNVYLSVGTSESSGGLSSYGLRIYEEDEVHGFLENSKGWSGIKFRLYKLELDKLEEVSVTFAIESLRKEFENTIARANQSS